MLFSNLASILVNSLKHTKTLLLKKKLIYFLIICVFLIKSYKLELKLILIFDLLSGTTCMILYSK